MRAVCRLALLPAGLHLPRRTHPPTHHRPSPLTNRRFAGEGRLAAPGSRNGPSWVDGELLQFRSPPRPDSLTEGAGLGFLWQPDGSGSKRYLVLLKKVALETL